LAAGVIALIAFDGLCADLSKLLVGQLLDEVRALQELEQLFGGVDLTGRWRRFAVDRLLDLRLTPLCDCPAQPVDALGYDQNLAELELSAFTLGVRLLDLHPAFPTIDASLRAWVE
jgi:hypothetical protein